MKPLISIIVPIYNVEAYLERGVDSALSQSYPNIEVILVDDGSTDMCPSICDAYAKKDSRVRVIHKENGGLSDARNAGMEIATGEYYAFLDSDDYYAPDFLTILYEQMIETGVEVAVCEYEKTGALSREDGVDFEKAVSDWEKSGKPHQVYDRREMLLNQYETRHPRATEFVVAWNKLYKASLFDGITYPKGRIHEDEATTYLVFDKIKKGVFVPVPLYGYFFMQESITRAKFTKKRLQWFDALDERIQFFHQLGDIELEQEALRARADAAIRYYDKLIHSGETDTKEEIKRLKRYVKEIFRKQTRLAAKTKVGYVIFLVCPPLHKRLLHY